MPVEMLRRPPGVWRASFSLVLCRESVSKSQTLGKPLCKLPMPPGTGISGKADRGQGRPSSPDTVLAGIAQGVSGAWAVKIV